MKRFLLYLSALFLSVSFANAQTYEINSNTGTLANGNTATKSSVWSSTELAGFKLEADFAEAMNVNSGLLQLYAYNTVNGSDVTYTIIAPAGYLITEYAVKYKKGGRTHTFKIYADNVDPQEPGSTTAEQTYAVTGLSNENVNFYLSGANRSVFIKIMTISVTLQKVGEGGEAPVEYTVSATAGVGGTVTVNGGTDAVTTTGEVALVAVPDYGYKFKNWTVGTEEVATAAEYTTTVSSDTEFVANFEKLTDTNDWYASIVKPSFNELKNTTYVTAATLAGDVNVEVTGIQGGEIATNTVDQKCVTNAIEVVAGAEFDLNITYKLKWGDLAIYQIDNDGATKEYGYYYGSWEPSGSTAKVAQNIADAGISITEVVDGACTATFPITINENHNPGDVIVVRAITGVINNATNSAFEQGIVEGGYVDFLFVVTEEVAPKSYTLAVGETGWATLFLDFNAAIPADVKAYTVTAVNDGYVTLTQVTGVLPANTGVIVKAANGEYNFVSSTDEATNVDGNLLEGSVTDKNVQGEAYVLGVVEGAVGLYKAEAAGTSWLNNANKAYLPASVVPNKTVAFYGFDWDGTTGINEVTTESGNVKTVYDLTGRRVEEITAPGIYIVNGKKVLVK